MGIVSALIALSKSKSKKHKTSSPPLLVSPQVREIRFLVRYYNKCCGLDSSLTFDILNQDQDIMKAATNAIIRNLPSTCNGFFNVEGIYLINN